MATWKQMPFATELQCNLQAKEQRQKVSQKWMFDDLWYFASILRLRHCPPFHFLGSCHLLVLTAGRTWRHWEKVVVARWEVESDFIQTFSERLVIIRTFQMGSVKSHLFWWMDLTGGVLDMFHFICWIPSGLGQSNMVRKSAVRLSSVGKSSNEMWDFAASWSEGSWYFLHTCNPCKV